MTSSFFAAPKVVTTKTLLLAMTLLCLLLNTSFTKEGRQARPFSGTYELAVTIVNPSLPLVEITASGPGNASHLGRSWYDSETVIDFSEDPAVLTGTVVLTAANGDKLYTHFSGSPRSNGDGTATIVRPFTIDGGTGRFAGATGSFTGTTVDPEITNPEDIPGVSIITMKGTINY